MYIVHCRKLKKDNPEFINKVKHDIVENYLISIGGKLNSDQTHRVTRSIAIHNQASILCESYNQAIYIQSTLQKSNGGDVWSFEIINLNKDENIF